MRARLRVALVAATVVAAFAFAPSALATVTSSFANGTLNAASDGADAIAIACSGGNVQVNGTNPGTGPASCGNVDSIFVDGGPGANTIDLSAVDEAHFTGFPYVVITGGAGADTITGSAFPDEIDAGAGNDVVDGGGGDDTLDFTGTPNADAFQIVALLPLCPV